jgi:very-short-patch-repair endonuclease
MSEAEKKFYFVLAEILGKDYLIFSKVRMADLLYLPKMSNSDFYHYQNKIQAKHVDFLICDKENIKPLLAIELDDSSHLKMDRILRDKLVDKIFESAKLPILHIKFSNNCDSNILLDQINKVVCV